ncbi:hypothetical protein IPL68_03765 [Candidatus Saccharibacteria bacterium]|nr:MAG: hypothetical protein IPL68_03765 [Candidatus Saccharibacteria bacterium]
MKRKILLQAFAVIAGSIMCALFLAGGTANAQGGGGIGSGVVVVEEELGTAGHTHPTVGVGGYIP